MRRAWRVRRRWKAHGLRVPQRGYTGLRHGPAVRIAPRWLARRSRWPKTPRDLYQSSMGDSRDLALAASAIRICRFFALLAQLVEHFHGKEGVAGSSPAEGLRNRAVARFSCLRSGRVTTSSPSGSGRSCESPRALSARGCGSAVASSGRASFRSSARVPSGHRSVANTFPGLLIDVDAGAVACGVER
jgi:hypothetical protein